jgi:4-amino-4-deoxy-L-arabinose transferase-like glycosyltransferase
LQLGLHGKEAAAAGPRCLHVVLLVAVCAAMFLVRAGSLPLADPEESRCALIVRDMVQHDHWLVPHLQGEPYLDKPAPFFWLAALGVKLTGSAELGGRLVPALAALLAVLVTYAFARRVFADAYAGLLAGLVLATSGEFLFMARWYRMDMPFMAAMWAALWWFWRSEDRRLCQAPVSKAETWLGFYVFAAAATLFKGPAGLGLPALVITAYFMLSRQYRRVLEFFSPLGAGVYLLIAAPWYVVVSLRQPGYFHEFFLHQNLQRFAGGYDMGHNWPGVLYVPILLGGLLPWTMFLPGVVIRCFPRRWRLRNERPAMTLLWLAALVPLAFFSVSSTKLVSYILPVFPPLAVLIGGLIAVWTRSHQPDRLMKFGSHDLMVTVLIISAVPLAVELWLKAAGWSSAIPFAASLLALAAMRYALGHARRAQFVGWGIAAIVAMFLYLVGHTAPIAYEIVSLRTVAQAVDAAKLEDANVCFWSKVKLSFFFYTGLEGGRKFKHFGPEALRALVETMASNRKVYCLVTGADRLAELLAASPRGLHVVAGSKYCWLVTNDDSLTP